MSEAAVESEVPESGPVSVDDVLKAIQDKNLARAKAHFNDVMGAKINDALENEKVRLANTVFNGASEEEEVEEPEAEVELEVEDDLDDALEAELADAFEEEDEVEE